MEGMHADELEDSLTASLDLKKKKLCSSPLHSPAVMEVTVQLVLYLDQRLLFHPGPDNTCNLVKLCSIFIVRGGWGQR